MCGSKSTDEFFSNNHFQALFDSPIPESGNPTPIPGIGPWSSVVVANAPGNALRLYVRIWDGFSIAIYPSAGMGPACAALDDSYRYLLKNGSTEGSKTKSFDMKQLHELVGFQDVWDFEKRHVETK